MWLIAGLGNPGAEYEDTRHNIGFKVADAICGRANLSPSERKFKARLARGKFAGSEVLVLKPETFMNLSGESVGPALGFYKLGPEQVIAIHDDLDIEFGRVKLKKGGGHGGHNGLRSLIQHLPNAEFVRVRMGVGRPPPGRDSADYVLGRFAKSERAEVERMVDDAADAVESILREGLTRAMNTMNRALAPSPGAAKGQKEEAPKK